MRERTMKEMPRAVPRVRATAAQMPAIPSDESTTPTRSKVGFWTLIQVTLPAARNTARTAGFSGGILPKRL